MSISILSPAERDFIVTGLSQTPPSRLDGRDLLTSRPISISYAEAPQASGSSRVLIGGTEVVAGVRLEVGDVDSSAPKGKEGWRGKVEVDVYVSRTSCLSAVLITQNTSGLPSDEHFEPIDSIDAARKCYIGALYAFSPSNPDFSPYKVCYSLSKSSSRIQSLTNRYFIPNLHLTLLSNSGSPLTALVLAARAAFMDLRIPSTKRIGWEESETISYDGMKDSDLSGIKSAVKAGRNGGKGKGKAAVKGDEWDLDMTTAGGRGVQWLEGREELPVLITLHLVSGSLYSGKSKLTKVGTR
jgi:exosome complex component RRP42